MIKNDLFRKYYGFNLYHRDKWVGAVSKLVPKYAFVLDVGAGSAPYRTLFAHCNYKTHDFSQLSKSQLRGKNGYFEIDYVSDIVSIPVENESFDFILCTEVIEHVPYPIEAIKEISRVLKPGGKLFITAPLGSGLHQEPYHYYGGYTPYWYEKFLTDNGMKLISIEPNKGFYSFLSQELLRFLYRSVSLNRLSNILLLPLTLFLVLPSLLLPLFASFFDKWDTNRDFTVGYHVVAEKM